MNIKIKKLLLFAMADIEVTLQLMNINKQGFNAINLEGGYNAWKESKNKLNYNMYG